MNRQEEILSTIKKLVKEEIPDAKVYLFGSRVTGKIHDESDWDILILTSKDSNRILRKKIFYKLFPLSLKIFDSIDCTIANEKEWTESGSYYVLRNSIEKEAIPV